MNFSGAQTTNVVHGDSFLNNQTPATPVGPAVGGESVTDSSNGLSYWHFLIGDPASGFAQEVYIQKGGFCYGGQGVCSASAGMENLAPGLDPLGEGGTNTGNGSGNPNRLILRMVLGGSWEAGTRTWTCDTAFCVEFIKASYANKAKITQGINDGDLSSGFVIDASGVALSDNATPLTLTNGSTGATGASLTGTLILSGVGSFDMAEDSQLTHINGGQYLYNAGTGRGGSNGTYSYLDGSYNPLTVDYTMFFDHTVSNPWSYSTHQP